MRFSAAFSSSLISTFAQIFLRLSAAPLLAQLRETLLRMQSTIRALLPERMRVGY